LREEIVFEEARIGVDIVDGAAVDADGGEDARIRRGAGEIGADAAVFKKDGTARVAAFDAAIEIVPLVHPADRGVGLLRFVEVCERFGSRDLAEQRKNAVKDASVIGGGDDEAVFAVNVRVR